MLVVATATALAASDAFNFSVDLSHYDLRRIRSASLRFIHLPKLTVPQLLLVNVPQLGDASNRHLISNNDSKADSAFVALPSGASMDA